MLECSISLMNMLPGPALLHAWLTITMTVARNCSFAECVLGKLAALVLIVSQEASKQLPSSVVTGDGTA